MKKDFMAVLSKRPSEMVDVAGIKIEIRGLSLGEARALEQKYEDTDRGLAVICASCFIDGAQAFTMESIGDLMPQYIQQLDAAIGRVNSHTPGN